MSPLHQLLHFVLLFPTSQLDCNPKIEVTLHNQTEFIYLGPSLHSVPCEGDTAGVSGVCVGGCGGVWAEKGWKGTERSKVPTHGECGSPCSSSILRHKSHGNSPIRTFNI
jgi:hypothetical protein